MLKFNYNSIYYIDSKKNKFEFNSFEDFGNSLPYRFWKKGEHCVVENFKIILSFFLQQFFIFSSNLKNIYQFCGVKAPISEDAIEIFLNTGFIPAPFTIYNNSINICPGYRIKSSASVLYIIPDWLITEGKFEISDYKNILFNALENDLKNSKKTCFTLSGGVDSSLLVSMGKDLVNETGYTLTSKMDGFKNELEIARLISKKLDEKNLSGYFTGRVMKKL